MRHNPKLDVKIKLNPDQTSISPRSLWLHVEWFKIGGRKPRKYVDHYWLTENEAEATLIEPFRAKELASEAVLLASHDGDGDMKAVYMVKSGRKWIKTTLKKALAAEKAREAKQFSSLLHY